MSGLLEMIAGQLDEQSLGNLGKQLGVDSSSLTGAVAAALPMLLGGVERNARSSAGAEQLQSALSRDHDGSVLDNLSSFFDQQPSQGDARMVDHMLGSKRQAAERALSAGSGLNQDAIGGLLQNLAPLVMGALGKQSGAGGFGLDQLTGLLGSEASSMSRDEPAAMGMVNQVLDADGDGDVDISDLVQQGAGLLGSFMKR